MAASTASTSLVASFFSRLEQVCTGLEDQVRSLELRQRRIGRKVDETDLGTAAEAAEAILEEVTSMSKHVSEINVKVKREGVDTLTNFLDEAVQQFEDMRQIVRKYEAWGSQYGYVPQFNLELNLEDALKIREETMEQAEAVEQPRLEKETVPSLLDFGLSKHTLNKMGYTFKEDLVPTQEDSRSAAAETSAIVEAGTTSKGASSVSYNWGEASSYAASASEDDTPPAPILKKALPPPPETPQFRPAMPDFGPETSRIEITPGLFVRKPRGGKSAPQQVTVTPVRARKTPNPFGDCMAATDEAGYSMGNDSTPQAPELRTVNLQKLLAESRKNEQPNKTEERNVAPAKKFQTPERSDLENRRPQNKKHEMEDLPPQPPTLSSKKLRQLASSGKKYQKSGESFSNISDDEPSPGPPERPKLTHQTMAMLKERGAM